jgi:DTW domain-containing protein YfiP
MSDFSSTGKRHYCERCKYPLKTCICSGLSRVESRIKISILQDPIESKHAKNTARLALLMLENATVYVGLTPDDFTDVQNLVKHSKKTLLIYPSDQATKLTEVQNVKQCDHLILLDATWRKAKKLWLNNPWLHNLTACAIEPEQTSAYHIRKAPDNNSLSTLEALAETLRVVEGVNPKPFMSLLADMQKHWPKV